MIRFYCCACDQHFAERECTGCNTTELAQVDWKEYKFPESFDSFHRFMSGGGLQVPMAEGHRYALVSTIDNIDDHRKALEQLQGIVTAQNERIWRLENIICNSAEKLALLAELDGDSLRVVAQMVKRRETVPSKPCGECKGRRIIMVATDMGQGLERREDKFCGLCKGTGIAKAGESS